MPRYFFHVYDDAATRDEEGVDLPNVEAARRQALAGARDIMCGQMRDGRLSLTDRVDVEDERGEPVLTLAFADAVAIDR